MKHKGRLGHKEREIERFLMGKEARSWWSFFVNFGSEKFWGQLCIIIRLKITLTDRANQKILSQDCLG
jgi:hypothetical protein